MVDVFEKSKRSQIMASVRSSGNRATELKLAAIFRAHNITGWRRRQALPGKPDFVFRREHLAVFVDGCFWHGCPRHMRLPKSNSRYWRHKIAKNKQRDMKTTRRLKKAGWRVLRVWEHSLRSPGFVAQRLKRHLIANRQDCIAHEKLI